MATRACGASLEERTASLLERVFDRPASSVSLERLSGGASQETYRVRAHLDGAEEPSSFALRRAAGGRDAMGPAGHGGLRTEARLFQVARDAGIPEPEVHAVLEPADRLGEGFLMEWLEGETLGPRIVRSERFAGIRPRLARECGEILARIHRIDPDATGLGEELRTVKTEEFVRETWGNYRRLDTVQPMIDYTALWLLRHLPEEREPALVHNDFRNGNLMVSATGVIAVLDWELAHLGDPGRDLGWICCNSWRFGGPGPVGGFGTRDDLYDGYEAVAGEPVDRERARWWEVFGSFWWAVGTLGMAQQYRVGPDRTVERPAIGRRTSECQMDCVNLLFPGPFEVETPNPGAATREARDLADAADLVTSVRDFLRTEVMAETRGRTRFLARVASNSLDVVLREQALGGRHLQRESRGLESLGCAPEPAASLDQRLRSQRAALVAKLEAGAISLDDETLRAHLRETVAQRLAIDQPGYSALRRPPSSPTEGHGGPP